jgi:hypothetical protein
MASDLASVDELALLLGLSESQAETDEDLLELILDGAVALFQSETDRSDTPFQESEEDREEIFDARNTARVMLDYPIASVSAIALGVNVASPSETLDPDDAAQVVYRIGKRDLVRTDGGLWSAGSGVLSWARGGALVPDVDGGPSFVKVTYTTQDDLPADAKAAVLRLAAQLYQQKDRGGVDSETLDNYTVMYTNMSTFADASRKDPAWAVAVQKHRRFVAL